MWDGNELCIKMNGEVYNQLSLSVDMHLHQTKHFHPHKLQLFSLCSPMAWAKRSIQQHNNTSMVLLSQPWIWACIYKAQWIGMVERFVDDVASKILWWGTWAQLTYNDRDKGGHEAHDLEASRHLSFFPFYSGYHLLPLMTERFRLKTLMTKGYKWWHRLWKTTKRWCEQGTAHG